MSHKILTVCALLLSAAIALGNEPGCGTTSNSYCLTERQFVLCGTIDPKLRKVFTCPLPNQFCSDVPGTCTTDVSVPPTTNTMCNVCSTGIGKGHTCTGFDSFEICEDGDFSITDTHFCETGKYCDAFSPIPDNPCSYFTGNQLLCWKERSVQIVDDDALACEALGAGYHPHQQDLSCRS